MAPDDLDAQVRLAAFRFVEDLRQLNDDVVPRRELAQGFDFNGVRVPLVGPQGIFKPAILREIPLSITTVPIKEGRDRPYEDEWVDPERIHYRYRGTDPRHPDNAGLRKAIAEQVPLVYFYGIVPGWYAPAWPVYVVGDDPSALTFTIQVDSALQDVTQQPFVEDAAPRRAYATRLTRVRLHQAGFRYRVIAAYRRMCAICRLRHHELLDAAHILPDTDPRSAPVVSNGLSLCRLHHAAFDRNVLGIRPDLVVEIRRDVLEEVDGPMLVHGLQGFSGARLAVPRRERDRPNPEFLAERYERFRAAG